MRLRYYTVMNKVDKQVVRQFAADNQLTIAQAARMLEDASPTQLQYLPDGGTAQDWTPVPFVVEYRE